MQQLQMYVITHAHSHHSKGMHISLHELDIARYLNQLTCDQYHRYSSFIYEALAELQGSCSNCTCVAQYGNAAASEHWKHQESTPRQSCSSSSLGSSPVFGAQPMQCPHSLLTIVHQQTGLLAPKPASQYCEREEALWQAFI